MLTGVPPSDGGLCGAAHLSIPALRRVDPRRTCGGVRIETKAGGRRSFWAQKWLPDVRTRRTKDKPVPGQQVLWGRCQAQTAVSLPREVLEVADRFFRAGFAWP